MLVAVPAEGLHGSCPGTGPLGHRAAGRAPGGVAVRVRAPVPERLVHLGPAVGLLLPRLPSAVGGHVEQAEGRIGRLVAPAGGGVGEEHAVAVAEETADVPFFGEEPRLHIADRVPGLRVAHELDVGSYFVPLARGQDGQRDAASVEVDGVLQVPEVEGAALALPLVRRAVVPHGVVDHELLAALEQVPERDRAVGTDDLGRPVDLHHRHPAAGRGDGVTLAGVGLLADEELGTGGLPGGHVNDRRAAGQRRGQVTRDGGHGSSVGVSGRPASFRRLTTSEQTRHPAQTHRRSRRSPAPTVRSGGAADYVAGLITRTRSPPSTCWTAPIASRCTVPATGAVIAASIFIASMVATVAPASTSSPSATAGVTTPANGAATCPGWCGSARSATLTSTWIEVSRTRIGRNWPLMVHITVRMPRSSGAPIADRPRNRLTPLPIRAMCSSPGRRP